MSFFLKSNAESKLPSHDSPEITSLFIETKAERFVGMRAQVFPAARRRGGGAPLV